MRCYFAMVMMLIVSGCASAPEEKFSESFFTYQDHDGKKYFSFILQLDGALKRAPKKVSGQTTTPRKNGGNRKGRRQNDQLSPRENKHKNAQQPSKFHMEEIAHKRMMIKLSEIKYCDKDIQIEQDEFVRLEGQYKIKGFCLD
ncbi:hypothetical protein [Aliikangiella coralliicola]|uniref:Lipoprotein n=1 Tax=Aliikangiella coralliicola TaxID=2592383 RepID=A0A545UHY5_9GAMM|nr:hypothetical protein [Aliikangiella coralliicola]TQV89080.1 hypothetical protein FLL46_06005 [Aliikangiella coralliicola]